MFAESMCAVCLTQSLLVIFLVNGWFSICVVFIAVSCISISFLFGIMGGIWTKINQFLIIALSRVRSKGQKRSRVRYLGDEMGTEVPLGLPIHTLSMYTGPWKKCTYKRIKHGG